MKIFIIKGILKGMVKIDYKMHLVGENFELVDSVILYDGMNIQVIKKNNFNVSGMGFNYHSVVLLDRAGKVLGAGSTNGVADINSIMLIYKKLFYNKQKSNIESNQIEFEDSQFAEGINRDLDSLTDLEGERLEDSQESNFTERVNLGEEKQDISIDIGEMQTAGNKYQKEQCETVQNAEEVYADELFIHDDENVDKGVDFIKQAMNNVKDNGHFYAEIKEDLNKFLSSHPKNEELESKVWGSKWVKIHNEYDYSVGVIFEDDIPSIIAYAIPYSDCRQVDTDSLKFGEWLNIEDNSAENRGYFVYYQNAQTGKMILNEI